MRRTIPWATALVIASALTATACGGPLGSGGTEGNKLEVFSWWTSGSEATALDALVTQFKKDNPGTQVKNGAVSGGGGSNAQQVLQTRLAGGNPPDTWQAHPGKAISELIDNRLALDVTDVYEANKWKSVMPKAMVDAMSKNGRVYGVLTGVHRGNVLWFNKAVLAKAGVKVGKSMNWQGFNQAIQKLQDKDIRPLCLGDKDIFASAEVLENLLVGRLGADGWNKLVDGKTPWSDPKVRAGVKDYMQLLGKANDDHSAMTWDQAVKLMADGGCGFNTMGDWAYGELLKYGKADGKDFGYVAFPGADNTFVAVGDAFVASAATKNPTLVNKWLASVGSKESQLAFNKAKGSTPVRTDVDVSSLGAYQQAAAKTFRTGTLVNTLVHGQATSPQFQQAFFDAINQLNTDNDIGAFAKTLDAAAKE
ncbi:glucose/mannose transport system substrate-binding protein [Streptomyces sp. SLBN-118]|uniref:ABC transporter substrate-binding protein n=1 Tax=Streptomyces sp. SLBN-118 TaxID=2768454 RepID=UPI00114F780E|nr:ABC transporter substrate-binding protein [Streptomyces sp. SLBN-118]TQK51254.1 glucose/mannose transport system substrate-binding protein [Streptomyces sp. SLBN-118]